MHRTHLVLSLVIAVTAGAASAQDRIIRSDGVVLPLPGGRPITVTKETVQAIEYQLQGIPATLKIEPKQVSEIRYARVPDAYSAALRSMKDGMYEQAVAYFETALGRGGGFHWLKQNALYRIAFCWVQLGNCKRAVQTYRDLLREVPDTQFFGDAWNGIIQTYFLHGGVKNEKSIARAITEFRDAIRKNRLGDRWNHDIAYWKLRLRAAQGKNITTAAMQLAEQAVPENIPIANKARILIGDCLLKESPERAREFFARVRDSAGEHEFGAKAAAYRGLGECLFKTASEKDHKTLKMANDYFLRAIVLSVAHGDQVDPEDAARSLYYGGRCFVILSRKEPHNKRRARELFRELVNRFRWWRWPR